MINNVGDKALDIVPDYNFLPWITKTFIPVLAGNYYFTGAYVYYFPNINDLDVPTYGYQCRYSEPCFWYGASWRDATPEQLTNAFIGQVNSGKAWEPITEHTIFPYIQHGTYYKWVDSIPTNHNHLTSVTLTGAPDGVAGTALTGSVTAVCDEVDDGSYSYVYTLSGASEGLTIDNRGNINGVPVSAGDYTVNVEVTDSYGATATASDTGAIEEPAAPAIQSASISPKSATATQNASFTQSFTLSCTPADAFASASWNPLTGAADGLTLTKNGANATVSGVPTGSGTATLTGFVYDSYGTYKSASATITINQASPVYPTIQSASVQLTNDTATSGTAFNSTASCICTPADDGSYTYQYYFSGSPTGLTIDSSTGVISGVPNVSVTTTVQVGCTVKDHSQKAIAATKANLTVNVPTPTGNHISSVGSISGTTNPGHPKVGVSYTRDFVAPPSPSDDGTYSYNWYFSPADTSGLTLSNADKAQCTWSGTATKAGTSYLYCAVTDVYQVTKTSPSASLIVDS